MNQNEIILLFTGYAESTSETLMLANCSSTLIKGRNSIIIVDTRTAWDGDELVAELKKYDVKPKDVTHVVCTHGHSDHIGCNYLFLNAKEHIIGHSIAHRNEYRTLDETNDYEIDDGIRVRKTPGHTLDSVSVIVEKNNLVAGTVAVCGDLFENERDWSDSNIWIEAGTESIEQQRKSRHGIVEIADFVIPGHGSSFLVTEEIRKKLRDELNLSS